MVARGRVQNGVVVLDHGIRLPEGQEVTVVTAGTELDTAASAISVGRAQRHSALDIPPVSLGSMLRPLSADDDLLGEMLEGRS
jgi:hypothetical protein